MKIIKVISEQKKKNYTIWLREKIVTKTTFGLTKIVLGGWIKKRVTPRQGFERVMAIVEENGFLQTRHIDISK